VGEVRECQEILRQLRHFREMAGILKLQADNLDEEPTTSLHDVQVRNPLHHHGEPFAAQHLPRRAE